VIRFADACGQTRDGRLIEAARGRKQQVRSIGDLDEDRGDRRGELVAGDREDRGQRRVEVVGAGDRIDRGGQDGTGIARRTVAGHGSGFSCMLARRRHRTPRRRSVQPTTGAR
jgi:hypothetical protein